MSRSELAGKLELAVTELRGAAMDTRAIVQQLQTDIEQFLEELQSQQAEVIADGADFDGIDY